MASRHSELVAACIALIQAHGGLAWKSPSGRVPVTSNGKTRYVHAGRKGLPDVVGCLPWSTIPQEPSGRMVCVEVKAGRDPLRPEQKRLHEELTHRGALVVVCRDSVDELRKALT